MLNFDWSSANLGARADRRLRSGYGTGTRLADP